ncbi:hypothetical protein ACHAXT_007131 [Thalassiosira profunda]
MVHRRRHITQQWALLLLGSCIWTSCLGHRPMVSSAFIKKDAVRSFATRQRQRGGCKSKAVEASDTRSVVLQTRGGSSYADDYNDGYGSYPDDSGRDDDGRGYGNDGGYYNERDDGFDDRDRGYASSYGSESSSSRDRYYEDDYGRGSGGGGYYDDEGRYRDDYDDRGRGASSRSKARPKLPAIQANRKLGTIFLSSGAAFTVLGITLFFNKTLMRLGNLLFVAGVPLMIGPGRTMGYFLQPKKARATGCLACGIFLVMVGHPLIGILLEVFGLLNLFGNMFPLVRMMAKNLPVVGGLFGGGSGGGGGKRRASRYEDEDRGRYYEEDRYERSYRDERY